MKYEVAHLENRIYFIVDRFRQLALLLIIIMLFRRNNYRKLWFNYNNDIINIEYLKYTIY